MGTTKSENTIHVRSTCVKSVNDFANCFERTLDALSNGYHYIHLSNDEYNVVFDDTNWRLTYKYNVEDTKNEMFKALLNQINNKMTLDEIKPHFESVIHAIVSHFNHGKVMKDDKEYLIVTTPSFKYIQNPYDSTLMNVNITFTVTSEITTPD